MLATTRPTAQDEHARAVRMMAGNLAVDAGFGSWNFRWGTLGSVIASMSRDITSPGGRGYIELSPFLIKEMTVNEVRQVLLRLMIRIKSGKLDAQELWAPKQVAAPTPPDEAVLADCAGKASWPGSPLQCRLESSDADAGHIT